MTSPLSNVAEITVNSRTKHNYAGKTARSTFDFLRSKALRRLLAEGEGTFDFLSEDAIAALSEDTYTVDRFLVDIGKEGSQEPRANSN